jgi:hypothetical protein
MLYANAVKSLCKTEKMSITALLSLNNRSKSQKKQHRSPKTTIF